MVRILSAFLGMVLISGGVAGAQSLGPGAECRSGNPWTTPVPMVFPEPGQYRLEAVTSDGRPVEVVVERREPDGAWAIRGSNRTLTGSLAASIDLTVASGEVWRVKPPAPFGGAADLRLTKVAFGTLKETLKQGLVAGPSAGIPLIKRSETPLGTGGPGMAVTRGPHGTLWAAWPTATGAEAWDLGRAEPLGGGIQPGSTPWTALWWAPDSAPTLGLTGPGGTESRQWTGRGWVLGPPPSGPQVTTAIGTFRTETVPVPAVFRSTAAGWENLELPRETGTDRVLLGSTDDGLYVMTGSSVSGIRGFYLWRPDLGWEALPVPQPQGAPGPGIEAMTTGAGTLFYLEGRGTRLLLRQFDGTDWRPALDLSGLAPRGAVDAVLFPPSEWSKTGSLVLVTDRVTVYDLP